jgi:hypothetical protein
MRNLFWDPRRFKAISLQYWSRSGGAHGMNLHHLWIQNQSRWVPQGIRNSGLNLLEIPGSLNNWMGGRMAREVGFRLATGSLLAGTGYGSYKGTTLLLNQLPHPEMGTERNDPNKGDVSISNIFSQSKPHGEGIGSGIGFTNK